MKRHFPIAFGVVLLVDVNAVFLKAGLKVVHVNGSTVQYVMKAF